MIHPAFRTAKQGKDHARQLIRNVATDANRTASPETAVLIGAAVWFGTEGTAKECTSAYRRAYFDTIRVQWTGA